MADRVGVAPEDRSLQRRPELDLGRGGQSLALQADQAMGDFVKSNGRILFHFNASEAV